MSKLRQCLRLLLALHGSVIAVLVSLPCPQSHRNRLECISSASEASTRSRTPTMTFWSALEVSPWSSATSEKLTIAYAPYLGENLARQGKYHTADDKENEAESVGCFTSECFWLWRTTSSIRPTTVLTFRFSKEVPPLSERPSTTRLPAHLPSSNGVGLHTSRSAHVLSDRVEL